MIRRSALAIVANNITAVTTLAVVFKERLSKVLKGKRCALWRTYSARWWPKFKALISVAGARAISMGLEHWRKHHSEEARK